MSDVSAPAPSPSPSPAPATLALLVDGPLRLDGPVRITTESGEVVDKESRVFLCRCGASATKPFCDGTHKKIGFKSANAPAPQG